MPYSAFVSFQQELVNILSKKQKERLTRLQESFGEYLTEAKKRKTNEESIMQDYVRTEILRRDLTKRQTNIVLMILSMSLALGKKSATIPKLQDFQTCGISKTKVTGELNKLVECNVITWEKSFNTFTILNPIEWEAPLHLGYSYERMKEIYIINLAEAGVKVDLKHLEEIEKEY